MKTRGRIFVVSAPSGSGKTTICKGVLKRLKGIAPSVSVTTRDPRHGEKSGKDYHYTSERSFKADIKKGNFLEWEKNFNYFYGTPKKYALNKIEKGIDLLLSIDVKGAMTVRKMFTDSVLIFIKTPSLRELSRRLRARKTDKEGEIANRIKAAKKELKFAPQYDYLVINNKLEDAVDEVISIIKKERS
ncbi:MAG: guanylate kinase [Candidatus Omnitrophota bacterium]